MKTLCFTESLQHFSSKHNTVRRVTGISAMAK
jgi:hypothetical protein